MSLKYFIENLFIDLVLKQKSCPKGLQFNMEKQLCLQ
jgi:hypothetical protein